MGLWENIKGIMTIPDEDEPDDVMQEQDTPAPRRKEESPAPAKRDTSPRIIKSKTVNYTAAQNQLQVVLVKPDRFEDVTSIADHLNEGKTVVLNLEDAERDVSRRIVDFLSGVAYANGGNMRKVAKNTFIIAASGVDVMGELMLDELDEGKLYF